jgi:ABC-2 type transport system permease protein
MKRIWTIALRELRGLLDHPTGYILLLVFLGVNNFLFFRQAYLSGVASIRPMLELMPWLLLFLVPAVTMRALAEDTRTGTLEVVLAQPLSEWEFLIGKYLGSLLFLWLALALTLLVPVGLSLGADLSVGVIAAQYVGAALLIAGMTGVGIWASSLTKNQITAFIIGVGVMFVLILVGLDPLIVGLPSALGLIAARLGVLSHFINIGRGVIDLRDVIYFVSLGAVFVMLAYGALQGRRLSGKGEARKRLRVGVLVLVAAAIVVNLLGSYIGGRLDLTPGKAYTLALTTKSLVANLDDFLTIKLFASSELPPQVALVKRDIDDLLRDLRSASNGNVRIVEFQPGADDAEARSTARALGIPAVQFNVVGESRLQIQEGYMGLAIEYAGGTEILPFVRRTDDLEYQLATAIRGLTHGDERPVVGLLTSAQGQIQRPTFQALGQELSKTYDVRPLSLLGADVSAEEFDALIVAGHPDPSKWWRRSALSPGTSRSSSLE